MRRSGLEVRHSLPQHRNEGQGVSPGRPRCFELARKPQSLPIDQLRRRVMHVLLRGPPEEVGGRILRRAVRHRNRGSPPCGLFYTGEEVLVAAAKWKRANQIYVDCVEAFRGSVSHLVREYYSL
ncbi:hypothetical protein E2C01_035544 [Portunus trituberculatus]|uniref:Uncharacterized protein n=1 Tax=Portunus trituberculatus TaxID=210409 RepID=A0A5B7FA22_PORTR|nr:hypothetical protein [Portunus trituberculatus]